MDAGRAVKDCRPVLNGTLDQRQVLLADRAAESCAHIAANSQPQNVLILLRG